MNKEVVSLESGPNYILLTPIALLETSRGGGHASLATNIAGAYLGFFLVGTNSKKNNFFSFRGASKIVALAFYYILAYRVNDSNFDL